MFRNSTADGLVAEHDRLVAVHAAELADLRGRVIKKGDAIQSTLAELRSDLATVKDLESRLG